MKSEFLKLAYERKFVHQCTDTETLDDLCASEKPVTAYIGFDCTAPSLHVGSLVSIMLLRLFQKTGNKPIVLMGGGTTKVGDPSGKDKTRKYLSDKAIKNNMDGIKSIFSKFLIFGDGPTDAVMVNNADWLDNINYIDFLRDYGRLFSVNRMLTYESVKMRLDRAQPLSFLEFNYSILQAFDFIELARRYECSVQMGGSDQWGNITGGVDLGRRTDGVSLFGLTTPLLATSSGAKMGKTENGAVWLNEKKLSAYDYWQYWRNVEDADVGRFLRLFTELPIDKIKQLEVLKGSDLNKAKKVLADQATTLCHGETAAQFAGETARKTFEEGNQGDALPSIELSLKQLNAGIPAFELFKLAGLASSNGEARRLIKGGGGRLNDTLITNELQSISIKSLSSDSIIKLSAGKKRHALIKVS
jgi:tyrosyl-tRNA synthetase